MKKQQIKLGGKYTDGKGSVREVIGVGPQYRLYNAQQEDDNLRYKLLAKQRGPYVVGEERNSTRASFAAWAKGEVV